MLILIGNTGTCESANLKVGLWITFSIHISTFILLLFHFIGLGSILRKLGRILGLYYFFMVGGMIGA
jgi:hypothetical protein